MTESQSEDKDERLLCNWVCYKIMSKHILPAVLKVQNWKSSVKNLNQDFTNPFVSRTSLTLTLWHIYLKLHKLIFQ